MVENTEQQLDSQLWPVCTGWERRHLGKEGGVSKVVGKPRDVYLYETCSLPGSGWLKFPLPGRTKTSQ